jgi:hypothetical protein
LRISVLFLLAGLAACATLDRITKVSGDGQIGAPGAPLPEPLLVCVTDMNGTPRPGVAVNFRVTTGQGAVSPAAATTDANGHASTTLTLGTSGTVSVDASIGLASVAFTASVPTPTAPVFTLIDDFDHAGAPGPWTFSSDPGARGSLTLAPGFKGNGARLAYDFTGGGTTTAMTLKLAAPVNAALVAFMVQSPAGIRLVLSVVDGAGQTFSSTLARPLEATDPAAWYRQAVALDGLQGGVASITIAAGDAIRPGEQGAIVIDDVGWIDRKGMDLDASTPLVPAPAAVAALATDLAVNIHFTHDDRGLDAAKAAGFTRVRMDLAWNWIETTAGVYDFSAFDALLTSLDARGMRAHFILDYGNPLHEDGPGWAPQSTATIQAFGDYVQAAAAHFRGRGVRYEVWNEPNVPTYWKPWPNPAQYAALAKEAIARLHVGDPQAEVTMGGLSGFDFGFIESYLQLGAQQGAQACGVHPYRTGAPETASDELLLMRSIVAPLPVWDTEWGYTVAQLSDPVRQGTWVARELLAMRALGVPVTVTYELQDDASGTFGVIDAAYHTKPAAAATSTLAARCSGRRFVGLVAAAPSSLHVLRLDGVADHLFIVWSDTTSVVVSFPTGSTAVDAFGNAIPPVAVGGRVAFGVSEPGGPIYVMTP